MKVPDKFCKEN